MSEHSPGANESTCKFIAAFIALSSHLIYHQIDVTSAHFSFAFNIPINNISIYFSKLFSFRCMLVAAGTASELVISQISKVFDPGGNNRIRKWFSMGSFGTVFVIRLIFLYCLYKSSNLGYYVYVILSIEAFFFGYFHASVVGLVPEHSVAVALATNISRFFILFFQLILDLTLGKKPLLMIKLQTWIGVLITCSAVITWIYYISFLCSGNSAQTTTNGNNHQVKEKGFGETLLKALSPFLMFFGGSMFKDFLFPGVLPYALLQRDKCHIINMLVPVANLIGPFSLYGLETFNLFDHWTGNYNCFWMLAIPMGVIFAYSMMAIHSRIPSARKIENSRPLVMLVTLGVVFCNGFLDPLSFGGVAKIVKKGFETENNKTNSNNERSEGNNSLLTTHLLSALFMRFVFSKVSVGYNDTRVSLGYCLPKFRPKHRMSRHNLGWYIFRHTFKTAWKDAGSDFKLDIKKYL